MCCLSCLSRALAVIPSFYVASGSRPVVMLSILSLVGLGACMHMHMSGTCLAHAHALVQRYAGAARCYECIGLTRAGATRLVGPRRPQDGSVEP